MCCFISTLFVVMKRGNVFFIVIDVLSRLSRIFSGKEITMVLRIVQVGMGGWGQSWAAHVVSQNREVETVAWVDVHAETLQRAQERLNLPAERCFSSLKCAFDTVESDAVLITASLPGHVPSALEALNAGKHVL